MTITEKVAYLKGLFDGMDFDPAQKEGKLIQGMLDVLEDIALSISDLEEETAALDEDLDELYEEVEELEEDLFEDEDEDEDDEECDCCGGFDGDLYEVICPTCEEEIYVDEDTLYHGKTKCPACGEELEFDLSELEEGESADKE